ncbi:uncharacterized protein LOC114263517 isoform X1 [Camellia sinensis]|uniref:uncharacterized protein LOC114263517 isoform X1 n=1 Tax=Camellia sinensis TaxID=4442 RepID=UPI001036D247|nr:uncharacterized protein LOC114263517 isoform X1 [Camellia sinensis]
MCLLYAGFDYYNRWCARVANFQVSISCNDAGDRFLYAYLETLQHYDFEKFDNPARWINSAFVMCDYLNKHDVEADKSLMDACLFGSDRGDYLNNHNVEANASFMDAYLAGSDECDYLNEHYDETNASFMDAYLSRLDEYYYLNKHEVVANASFRDAYLSRSDERVNLNKLNVEVDGSFMCVHLSRLYRCFHLSLDNSKLFAQLKDIKILQM